MATITTTIREPKTFQQIQDQQNELGKQNALESLNNNISKLIKAINEKETRKETEQDRQLKMNQLELSKLQLRRAQLGLAKDEKYYQDYSRKWTTNNSMGTSIGLDKNTSSNMGAIGVSALTGGALNPVIVKQLLFPIVTPLVNVTKALASFPGLIPTLFHKIGGKSSSAVASDPDRRLHGKLDQILGAIKDKTKSSKAKEEKEQSMLSKFLNALLLGAAGMFMASELLGGADGSIMNTLKTYGPAMIAGYALGGWKGALVAFGLQLASEVVKSLFTDADETKKIEPTLITEANKKLNSLLQGKVTIEENEFKAAVAGYALGGWKGALVAGGLVMAVTAWQKMTSETNPEEEPEEIKKNQAYNKINEWIASKTGVSNVFNSNDHFKFTLAGFMIAGPIGMLGAFAVGKVVGSETYQKIMSYQDKGLGFEEQLDKWKNSDPLGIGIAGTTLSAMIGLGAVGFMMGGVPGLMAGAMLGLVGGYAFNQWKDISKPNKLGYQTKFNQETQKNELLKDGKFTGVNYTQAEEDAIEEYLKTHVTTIGLTRENLPREFRDAIVKRYMKRKGFDVAEKELSTIEIATQIGVNGIGSFNKWWEEQKPGLNKALEEFKKTFNKFLDTEYETSDGKKSTVRALICDPFIKIGKSVSEFFDGLLAALKLAINGMGNSFIKASENLPFGLGAMEGPMRSLGESLVKMSGLASEHVIEKSNVQTAELKENTKQAKQAKENEKEGTLDFMVTDTYAYEALSNAEQLLKNNPELGQVVKTKTFFDWFKYGLGIDTYNGKKTILSSKIIDAMALDEETKLNSKEEHALQTALYTGEITDTKVFITATEKFQKYMQKELETQQQKIDEERQKRDGLCDNIKTIAGVAKLVEEKLKTSSGGNDSSSTGDGTKVISGTEKFNE